MSYIIKAALSNARHPEYGQVTIPFPILDEEYDRTVEGLEELQMGNALERDCQVDEVDSHYSVLKGLEGSVITLDELDYLAKRLDSFCTNEDAQFQAMAYKLGLSDIKDFINLTFCCHRATVITSFSDLEKVGKDHIMTLNSGGMSMAQYQALDGRKEALRLIEGGGATVTPFGVVYDNNMELEELYNGRQFPGHLYGPPLLAMEVCPTLGLSENQNPEYLCFPTASQQIKRAMLRAGIASFLDVQVRLDFDELPEKVADALDMDRLCGDDLPALNRMCQAIAPLKDADVEKLNAVVLMTETSGAGSICQLVESLDQFDFVPGIQTPEEYGRYLIQRSGRFEYDSNLENFYDYRRYGEQRIQQEGGQFNECSYVAYQGTVPLEDLMRSAPEEPRRGPQMGGLV